MTYKEYKKAAFAGNPELRKEYEALAPQYDIMHSTIQKWGNSQAIRLPKAILDAAQLGENESVQILAEKDKIIIKKATDIKHRTLKERLEGFEGDYEFEEWDTGEPVGKEVL